MDIDRIKSWIQTGYMDFSETSEVRYEIEILIENYESALAALDKTKENLIYFNERLRKCTDILKNLKKDMKDKL